MVVATDNRQVELYVEQTGEGPDVLLIAGLGDPVEAWQPQLDGLSDRYRLTAYDNRGIGRSPLPEEPFLGGHPGRRRRGGPALARRAGRSRGRLIRRQRHRPGAGAGPPRARPQPRAREHVGAVGRVPGHHGRLLALDGRDGAERAGVPRVVLPVDLHTARARRRHRGADHRGGPGLPVQARPPRRCCTSSTPSWRMCATGGRPAASTRSPRRRSCWPGGTTSAPRRSWGREVAEGIPGAQFEVWPEEAHPPFQEVPDAFNARVDAFWREVDAWP